MSCSILPREETDGGGGSSGGGGGVEGGGEGGGGLSEDSGEPTWNLTLLLRMADKMNRQLTCDIDIEEDTADCLTDELVYYGFISKTDRDKIAQFLDQSFQRLKNQQLAAPGELEGSRLEDDFRGLGESDGDDGGLGAVVGDDGGDSSGGEQPVISEESVVAEAYAKIGPTGSEGSAEDAAAVDDGSTAASPDATMGEGEA